MGGLCGGAKKGTQPKIEKGKVATKGNAPPAPEKKADPPVQAAPAPPVKTELVKVVSTKPPPAPKEPKVDPKEAERKRKEAEELEKKRLEEAERIRKKEEAERLEAERKQKEEEERQKKEFMVRIEKSVSLKIAATFKAESERKKIKAEQYANTRSLVMENASLLAAKLEDYGMLKRSARSLVIIIANLTNAEITMPHCQMATGIHRGSSANSIAPGKYEFFTFHNSFLTGLSGTMFLNHEKKNIRIGFSNPLVGACKGNVEMKDAGEPYDYKDKGALDRA